MVSVEMARCIAKISGDGNLSRHYIRYSNNSKLLRDEFKKDIIFVFGKIKFTEGVGNSGTPFVQIHGKFIIAKFLSYLSSYKSNYVFVPECVKNSENLVVFQYLRALFDDEGTVSLRIFNKTNEWKRTLAISSNSLQLLNDVAELLFKFGIKTQRVFRNKPMSNYDFTYVLGICGKKNYEMFRQFIGFKIIYKKLMLDILIESYGNTYFRNRCGFEKIKKKMNCFRSLKY